MKKDHRIENSVVFSTKNKNAEEFETKKKCVLVSARGFVFGVVKTFFKQNTTETPYNRANSEYRSGRLD